MNQQELESLPFPMFKTTKKEKALLKLALPKIMRGDHYVCCVLDKLKTEDNRRDVYKLANKITDTVGNTLLSYLRDRDTTLESYARVIYNQAGSEWADLQVALKRIWIPKLLAYKGE